MKNREKKKMCDEEKRKKNRQKFSVYGSSYIFFFKP